MEQGEYSLSEREFARIKARVYAVAGISLSDAKRTLVVSRLSKIVRALRLPSFDAYVDYLERGGTAQDGQDFVNALTTNLTRFYREDHQLRCLTTDLLAERIAARGKAAPIRIWSVPCSTGEEPYSVAMWMLENWPLVDEHEIEILGSDIDTQALEAAREGIFGKRALMRLTPELIAKYFTAMSGERWRILDDLRDSVRFSTVNIVEQSETRPHGAFDVIFCRNVLIYFDKALQNRVHSLFYDSLVRLGVLCLGSKETLKFSKYEPCYDRLDANEKIYRKVR